MEKLTYEVKKVKILKPVILSICAVFIAIISAVASYIITGSILNKTSERVFNEEKEVRTLSAAEKNVSEAENDEELKKYFIKLEGDKINIYVNYESHEELLFGEQINISDLSEEDIKVLTKGIEFDKMSELYAFAENFTS